MSVRETETSNVVSFALNGKCLDKIEDDVKDDIVKQLSELTDLAKNGQLTGIAIAWTDKANMFYTFYDTVGNWLSILGAVSTLEYRINKEAGG